MTGLIEAHESPAANRLPTVLLDEWALSSLRNRARAMEIPAHPRRANLYPCGVEEGEHVLEATGWFPERSAAILRSVPWAR